MPAPMPALPALNRRRLLRVPRRSAIRRRCEERQHEGPGMYVHRPCPELTRVDGEGGHDSRAGPSRSRPAAARTSPSYSPASSLASLVSTLPRTSITSRSGRNARIWARRRWRCRFAIPPAPCPTRHGSRYRAPSHQRCPRRRPARPRGRGPPRSAAPRAALREGPWPNAPPGRPPRIQQRTLDRLDEAGLVPDVAVGGLDRHDLGATELLGDRLRLHKGQRTTARAEPKGWLRHRRLSCDRCDGAARRARRRPRPRCAPAPCRRRARRGRGGR